jgi:hypothetical protein
MFPPLLTMEWMPFVWEYPTVARHPLWGTEQRFADSLVSPLGEHLQRSSSFLTEPVTALTLFSVVSWKESVFLVENRSTYLFSHVFLTSSLLLTVSGAVCRCILLDCHMEEDRSSSWPRGAVETEDWTQARAGRVALRPQGMRIQHCLLDFRTRCCWNTLQAFKCWGL